MTTALTNARLVCRDSVRKGTIVFDGADIDVLEEGASQLPGAIDCEGDFLLPGLVEMHTDNMERHLQPRPGVMWPSTVAALLAHDTQLCGAGITTVLDAISVGEYREGGARRELLTRAIEGLADARRSGVLKAEHFIHMRCEISDDAVVEMFEPHVDDPMVRLVSIMDHTPGQRQWRDLEKLKLFQSGKGVGARDFDAYVKARVDAQERNAERHRKAVLELWSRRGLPVATHDDTTEAHVAEAVADGATISEFPTTTAAARKARELGMHIVMGAPNLVRGESHSGNVSAKELAGDDLLDGLSSDYVPVSLLHSAFILQDGFDVSLADAIRKISTNVAEMLGFHDRGELAPGKRADLIRVRRVDGTPVVRAVWREGQRVF